MPFSKHGSVVGCALCVCQRDIFKINNSVIATQRIFRWHFNIGRHGKVPDCNSIKNWVEKFRTTVSTTNRKPGSSVRTVSTPENIERVRAAIGCIPKQSAHRHSITLNISSRSRQQIVHSNLHYHPYKIQIMQELSDCDFASRRVFCEHMLL
jgi:hypothetical protein